ncbi:SDR family NAD(P)-dependent oxidoreductase [Microbacterium sp. gxy059]|uniref:SDR family NAD(P)-dependent oxidoreductase n=1 Tax=Microbacterium sp. gxy059 TaxID=2957199 RepID=UPI003D994043
MVARRFGREGFSVALIARNREKLDALAAELQSEGIEAKRYVAEVRDRAALVPALDAAADLGPIEVLQHSPVPNPAFLKPVLETTPEDLQAAAGFSILGPVTAIRHVLPGMRELGRGTILLPNGSSAAAPNGAVAGTSVAFAGESAYGAMLHEALKPVGIHVGQLIIAGWTDGGEPAYASAALAERLWGFHTERGALRAVAGDDQS